MGETIRIRTTPNGGDSYVTANINQNFDFIKILSLKISQEEAYRTFCSDYGVVVGRVIVNKGFGVPNAKVSVFIPVTEEDKLDAEIFGLYPYEIVSDKNIDGFRYNLLPKNNETNSECYTPVGSFPSKREVLENKTWGNIYCKYYKFTTTTNHAGDYMLFGVPNGSHIIHVDVDLSDIGVLSQRPYDFIEEGASIKQFNSPTKFKGGNNLDALPQVKSYNVGVNVQPFWGDVESCEIGITRVDIDLNHNIQPSAIFMGSIFGDSGKNGVNRRCRPRKEIGKVCETTTNSGNISVIRKTNSGGVEELNIEGGRLIDDNGVWAFKIPMNLDYKVTDEFGNIIPSNDPEVGIPTKTSVRFKVEMDDFGSTGKLQTKAKYLIPNNPTKKSELDFSFGANTKESSFRDLYWNKIYTVKSFIPRFQRKDGALQATTRKAVHIKDVDGCVGDKTPFPYNRMDRDTNPLFTILCIFINIFMFLVWMINGFIVRILNILISILNGVLVAICGVFRTLAAIVCFFSRRCRQKLCLGALAEWDPNKGRRGRCVCKKDIIPNVPCIVLPCQNQTFAPGCSKGSKGFDAYEQRNLEPDDELSTVIDHYPGCEEDGGDPHIGHKRPGVGYPDCVAATLAESLGMFEFDFYNDWVNGTLYAPLLRYKRRGKKKQQYCDYDCADYDSSSPNKCFDTRIIDTCVGDDSPIKTVLSHEMKGGFVVNYNDELYYSPLTQSGNYKLFSTDIYHLGSVFDCDWQGIPKIQQYLLPTTYKKPPLINEVEDDGSGTCGMSEIGRKGDALFFEVKCFSIKVTGTNCDNIKKLCEYGVDIPGYENNSGECIVSIDDIYDASDTYDAILSRNRHVRNVLYGVNIGSPEKDVFILSEDINNKEIGTSFNIDHSAHNYVNHEFNGISYNEYRGYLTTNNYNNPTGNSYYFYFGLIPGKTALDKMNSKYFTQCKSDDLDRFFINVNKTNTTTINSCDGGLIIEFYNGTPSYYYQITGPNGYYIVDSKSEDKIELNGLCAGEYTISVNDSLGNSFEIEVEITKVPDLACSFQLLKNTTTESSDDGRVMLINILNGVQPFSLTHIRPNGTSQTFTNVKVGDEIYNGSTDINSVVSYGKNTFILSDSSETTQTCTSDVFVDFDSTNLSLEIRSIFGETCVGSNDGSFNLRLRGGTPPYTIQTTTPSGDVIMGRTAHTGLSGGTYTTIVTDSTTPQQSAVISVDIEGGGEFSISDDEYEDFNSKQCTIGVTIIKFNLNAPLTTKLTDLNVEIIVDGFVYDENEGFVLSFGENTLIFDGEIKQFINIVVEHTESGCYDELEYDANYFKRPSGILSVTISRETPESMVLLSTPMGGLQPYNYQWIRNTTPIPSATAPTYTVPSNQTGEYLLRIVDDCGFAQTSNVIQIT